LTTQQMHALCNFAGDVILFWAI